MTIGNRIFWGIIGFIGVHFLFLGLLEQFVPLWVGTILGTGWIVYFIVWGPSQRQEQPEKGV